MTQYAMLWQINIYFKYVEADYIQIRSNNRSVREKLIDISSVDSDDQNIDFLECQFPRNFCFSFWIRVLWYMWSIANYILYLEQSPYGAKNAKAKK